MTDDARQYHIEDLLGRGGFGAVYRARMVGSAGFSKMVAVKLLRPERSTEDDLARFRDEALLLARLSHRAVVRIDALVRLGDRWALVMEYLDGVDLSWVLRNHEVPIPAAVQVIEEVASVLDLAWRTEGDDGPLHLVHRDIKPGNIRLTPTGQVKLLDFGLATAAVPREAQTATGEIMGTASYMSPERFVGECPPASDIYSLGAVLMALLGGGRGSNLGVMGRSEHDAVVAGRIERLGTKASPELLTLLGAMLSYEPEDRPDAATVARACRDLRRELGTPWLEDWAPGVMSDLQRPTIEDALVGVTLSERTAQALPPAAEPSSATHASGGSLLAGFAGLTFGAGAGLVTAAVVFGGLAAGTVWWMRPAPEQARFQPHRLSANDDTSWVTLLGDGEKVAWVTSDGRLQARDWPLGAVEDMPLPAGMTKAWRVEQMPGGVLIHGEHPSYTSVRLQDDGTEVPMKRTHGLSPSHDGRRIAWVEGTSLRVGDVEGDAGSGDTLFTLPEWNRLRVLAWSPDDQFLAYVRTDRSAAFVEVVSADGKTTRQLHESSNLVQGSDQSAIDWPKQDTLLFVETRRTTAGHIAELLRIDPAHPSTPVVWHTWTDADVLQVSASSDSEHIAVSLYKSQQNLRIRDTEGVRALTAGHRSHRAMGTYLGLPLLLSDHSGSWGIWQLDEEGELRSLRDTSAWETWPVPCGEALWFWETRPDQSKRHSTLMVMEAGEVRPVMRVELEAEAHETGRPPPNEHSVACDAQGQLIYSVVEAGRRSFARLHPDGSTEALFDRREGRRQPWALSPEGDRIAVGIRDEGRVEVMNLQGAVEQTVEIPGLSWPQWFSWPSPERLLMSGWFSSGDAGRILELQPMDGSHEVLVAGENWVANPHVLSDGSLVWTHSDSNTEAWLLERE